MPRSAAESHPLTEDYTSVETAIRDQRGDVDFADTVRLDSVKGPNAA